MCELLLDCVYDSYEQVYIEPFWVNVVAEQDEKRYCHYCMWKRETSNNHSFPQTKKIHDDLFQLRRVSSHEQM